MNTAFKTLEEDIKKLAPVVTVAEDKVLSPPDQAQIAHVLLSIQQKDVRIRELEERVTALEKERELLKLDLDHKNLRLHDQTVDLRRAEAERNEAEKTAVAVLTQYESLMSQFKSLFSGMERFYYREQEMSASKLRRSGTTPPEVDF